MIGASRAMYTSNDSRAASCSLGQCRVLALPLVGIAMLAAAFAHSARADEPPEEAEGVEVTVSDMDVDPIRTFFDTYVMDSDVNRILAIPQLTEAALLDINSDGIVDEWDLDSWRDGLIPRLVRGNGRIERYAYEAYKDINANGVVDVLDFYVLLDGIAKSQAEAGRSLYWRDQLVDPYLNIIFFDGVNVVRSNAPAPNTQGASGNDPVSGSGSGLQSNDHPVNGGDLSEEVPCGPHVVSNSSWPDLVYIDHVWEEYRVVGCGEGDGMELIWDGRITIRETPYAPSSSHVPCGEEGPTVSSVSVTATQSSTISAEIGVEIEELFSFGVTWGASSSTSITQQVTWYCHSTIDTDDTCWNRFLKYVVRYRLTSPCPDENVDQTTTIFTMSQQGRKKIVTCGTCDPSQ